MFTNNTYIQNKTRLLVINGELKLCVYSHKISVSSFILRYDGFLLLIQSHLIQLLLLKRENIITCPPLAKDIEPGKCMAVLLRITAIFADKLNKFSEFYEVHFAIKILKSLLSVISRPSELFSSKIRLSAEKLFM